MLHLTCNRIDSYAKKISNFRSCPFEYTVLYGVHD